MLPGKRTSKLLPRFSINKDEAFAGSQDGCRLLRLLPSTATACKHTGRGWQEIRSTEQVCRWLLALQVGVIFMATCLLALSGKTPILQHMRVVPSDHSHHLL